jgi:hypothetical protein
VRPRRASREALEKLVEEDLTLGTSQGRSDADMDPVAEGQVLLNVAPDVVDVRVLERTLVAVGRAG